MNFGANRIVPGVSITWPLGNPKLSKEDEYKIRKNIFMRCITALSTELEAPAFF
jgi:glycine reductase